MSDTRWTRPCSLTSCPEPTRAHHHHWWYGHLTVLPCRCADGGEPGTILGSAPQWLVRGLAECAAAIAAELRRGSGAEPQEAGQ